MIPNQSNLDAFFLGLDAKFWQGYQTAAVNWDKIAMLVPSTSSATLQGWMQSLPSLRKWTGSRIVQAPVLNSYRITNDPYEETLAIDKFAFADDEHMLYGPAAQFLGAQAAKWPDYMLYAMLAVASGDGPTAFDGKAMFATDHPCDASNILGAGTYANKFTTKALNADNFQSVRQSMMGFKGPNGQAMGIIPDLLVVPPELEMEARMIMNGSFIAPGSLYGVAQVGSSSNILQGMCDILVIPELSAVSATSWYLLSTKGPIKPFIFQQRQAPQFVYKNSPTDDDAFYKHQFVYGVEARGAVGVSLPFLACRATA